MKIEYMAVLNRGKWCVLHLGTQTYTNIGDGKLKCKKVARELNEFMSKYDKQ